MNLSCSKRLDLEPPIGLSSVDVYKDASNYEKVIAKLYAGMSWGTFKSCLLIMLFADGMM